MSAADEVGPSKFSRGLRKGSGSGSYTARGLACRMGRDSSASKLVGGLIAKAVEGGRGRAKRGRGRGGNTFKVCDSGVRAKGGHAMASVQRGIGLNSSQTSANLSSRSNAFLSISAGARSGGVTTSSQSLSMKSQGEKGVSQPVQFGFFNGAQKSAMRKVFFFSVSVLFFSFSFSCLFLSFSFPLVFSVSFFLPLSLPLPFFAFLSCARARCCSRSLALALILSLYLSLCHP